MRRPRHLSPEEKSLWDRVSRKVDPLEKREAPKPRTKAGAAPKPKQVPAPERQTTIPRNFGIGSKASAGPSTDLAPSISARLASKPVAMDRKSYGRMKRGKLRPEARLDLHGMTLDRAHPALTGFLLRAFQDGLRLVLVITGKGKDRDEGGPIPTRRGVLRHQVPQWLEAPPLSQIVLQVSKAHISHGGDGAYYVYLRRSR